MQASLDLGRMPFLGRGTDHPVILGKVTDLRIKQSPISLTTILCKMCEHIVHCANIDYLSEHDILTDSQHGFLQKILWHPIQT